MTTIILAIENSYSDRLAELPPMPEPEIVIWGTEVIISEEPRLAIDWEIPTSIDPFILNLDVLGTDVNFL